jgi:hypothetical protein
MICTIVRWSRNAQLSPTSTSRAAVAFSTRGQALWAGKADYGIALSAAGPATIAGGARLGRGPGRNSPAGMCLGREAVPITVQRWSRPLVAPPLEIGAGSHPAPLDMRSRPAAKDTEAVPIAAGA